MSASDDRDTVRPQGDELGDELVGRALVIAPSGGDRGRIPILEIGRDVRPIRGEDRLHPTRETAPLGLDEVADALAGAPFARPGAPAAVGPEGGHLRFDDPSPGDQQVRDPVDRQGLDRRVSHAGASGSAGVAGAAGTVCAEATVSAADAVSASTGMIGSSPSSASQHAAD